MAAMTPLDPNLAGQKPGNVLDHAVSVDAKRCLNLTAIEPESEPLSALMGRNALTSARHRRIRHELQRWARSKRQRFFFQSASEAKRTVLTRCIGSTGKQVKKKRPKVLAQPRKPAQAHIARGSRTFLSVATDAPLIRLTTFQPPKGQPVTCEGVSVLGITLRLRLASNSQHGNASANRPRGNGRKHTASRPISPIATAPTADA